MILVNGFPQYLELTGIKMEIDKVEKCGKVAVYKPDDQTWDTRIKMYGDNPETASYMAEFPGGVKDRFCMRVDTWEKYLNGRV